MLNDSILTKFKYDINFIDFKNDFVESLDMTL